MFMRKLFAFVAFFFVCVTAIRAQDQSTPGGYMSAVNEKIRNVNQTYINYLSAVSHGKSAKKVEKLREKTLQTIYDARAEVMGVAPYKNDKTLRDATVAYLKTCYSVFNEDYHKIVDMEEIAEQSYDLMEAYLLAQQKAGEKLEEAGAARGKVVKEFAEKYNVKLIDDKDALDIKMEQAGKVSDYYNKVYLVFFKSSKQEAYMVDAVNRNDINAVEQNRNALQNYTTDGLEQLEKIGAFESDGRVIAACRKALLFFKEEAESKVGATTDYLLAVENFNKIKKSFDALPASKKTQPEVDKYNKAVNDMNAAAKKYNKANTDVNKERSEVLNKWNEAVKDFMDIHMPYRK
jgi:hypothetical protein